MISVFGQLSIIFIVLALAFLYLIFLKKYLFAIFVPVILLGSLYYFLFDAVRGQTNISFDAQGSLVGIVKKLDQTPTKQSLVIDLEQPYRGRIKINARPYPSFQYGDRLKIEGAAQQPPSEFLNYYKKEGISGVISFPKIELMASGQGNPIKDVLLKIKNAMIKTFKSSLASQKAAFLSGLTLGERQDFSKEFQEKMSLSGTTHIVALSGYNVGVIAWAIGGIFGLYFRRSVSFYLSVVFVVLFVLMAGGEASVVRAAIMGIIMLLAKETERLFSIRNAIVVSAFLMTLFNPRILVFDLGFQLSFAALLGIVYVMPVLEKIFGVKEPGFLNWKENAVATLSAQLAVVPILLGNFGIFSLTSLLANILILSAIPLTMGLGFVMGALGFVSGFLSQVVGIVIDVFLTYELFVIDIFSKITVPVATESFGFFPAIIYYIILIGFIYKFRK